ncbi:uncharacterized protein APUU_70561S [Aspergillus puulaauensis]|uniref:Major facilitator superfamily (MFS) profile domain-containing protein n=1 Tax=Aspergillus puulaauensis TaxID=1220207 RepID=A0A7R8AS22_9EURO|nr:uncharacterized protein APUU_70561S [Aspergillus puulaauensis]BCS28991.1 hypothetical protein APUU_70561S [Aspergillus puulaauensis]
MSRTQWHVLAASAAINWSTYFIHDVPASLSTPLSEHLSLPDQQYAYLVSLLYAVYAVPNTVLPFFAGPAVQRFGERAVLLGTISSIVTGQLLFALSVATKFQLEAKDSPSRLRSTSAPVDWAASRTRSLSRA